MIEAKDATNWRTHIRLADGSVYPEAGKLNFSDSRVDPQTGTIRARAIFDNKDGVLLPGQFVRMTIDLGTRKMPSWCRRAPSSSPRPTAW